MESQMSQPLISDHKLGEMCPMCEQLRLEKVYEPDMRTWMLCGSFCNIGCWIGICMLPLLNRKFQKEVHFCVQCNKFAEG